LSSTRADLPRRRKQQTIGSAGVGGKQPGNTPEPAWPARSNSILAGTSHDLDLRGKRGWRLADVERHPLSAYAEAVSLGPRQATAATGCGTCTRPSRCPDPRSRGWHAGPSGQRRRRRSGGRGHIDRKWRCFDKSDFPQREVLVALSRVTKDGQVRGSGEVSVAGITHRAACRVLGLDRRWDSGQGLVYAFVIRPDGRDCTTIS